MKRGQKGDSLLTTVIIRLHPVDVETDGVLHEMMRCQRSAVRVVYNRLCRA